MIEITKNISLPESELRFSFARASGPGGQNVNKVSSAVYLHFDINHSIGLSAAMKQRLKILAGRRITKAGELLIHAQRFRTQERNRQDAIERLKYFIIKAAVVPKKRLKTRPSLRAKERRLQSKRCQSDIKKRRQSIASNS